MQAAVKITLWGIVQGVGFRPFAARLASRFNLGGEVRNTGGIVEIYLEGSSKEIDEYIRLLQEEKPVPAEIVHIKVERIQYPYGDMPKESFAIAESHQGDGEEEVIVPPDLAVCQDCLDEFNEKSDARYQHPFISCMACGPRYTIMDRLPYDRENTAMDLFPMCEICEAEYTDADHRRFHAQTISCHDCGPKLFWREVRSRNCEASLRNCEDSGTSHDSSSAAAGLHNSHDETSPLDRAVSVLKAGSIIAMKGVGGYNLLCNPFEDKAVLNLRKLKGREEKPFAVMFSSLESIKQYCLVSQVEENLLNSSARPIVLLEKRETGKEAESAEWEGQREGSHRDFSYETCRTSRYIGAFLPSMGAQYSLLAMTGPLIVTSANKSDQPMIKDDMELFDFADKSAAADKSVNAAHKSADDACEGFGIGGVLFHDRDIRLSVDDSVVRVVDGQPQMIRRAKGYAPMPLYIKMQHEGLGYRKEGRGSEGNVLALGGQLKNSFCLTKGSFAYVSQYFGDLDSEAVCQAYEENIDRMQRLFRVEPDLLACDLHPLYHTTSFGDSYARAKEIPVLKVQHHHAHIASVQAEHDLEGPVLGVSFDGTGYGIDGAIWGGEFLICENHQFQRVAHLEYVDIIGGDTSMKDGFKSALCYLHRHTPEKIEMLKGEAGDKAKVVRAGLEYGVNTIKSSSMGRLFDAVASLCGIHHYNNYEGECAGLLENMAHFALKNNIPPIEAEFEFAADTGVSAPCFEISAENIVKKIIQWVGGDFVNDNIDKELQASLALGFHYGVAEMIRQVCVEVRSSQTHIADVEATVETTVLETPAVGLTPKSIEQVALSGGVFQNKILMEKTLELLRAEGFKVYYNTAVSPGDGGICLGQAYIGMKYLKDENK